MWFVDNKKNIYAETRLYSKIKSTVLVNRQWWQTAGFISDELVLTVFCDLRLRSIRPLWRPNAPTAVSPVIQFSPDSTRPHFFQRHQSLLIMIQFYPESSALCSCRYLEVGGEQLEEEVQKKLEPTALSCFLNTAACKLKMQLWQDALDSCNEVNAAFVLVLYDMELFCSPLPMLRIWAKLHCCELHEDICTTVISVQ